MLIKTLKNPAQIFTQGSILFSGSDGLPAQDNANLFWDNTNKKLHIGGNIDYAAGGLGIQIDTSSPTMLYRASGAAANEKIWTCFEANSTQLFGRVVNDALTVTQNWITVTRSGAAVSSVVFPNGKVGIGIATPLQRLHLGGGGHGEPIAGYFGIIVDTGEGTNNQISLVGSSGLIVSMFLDTTAGYVGTQSNIPLHLRTNGGNRVTITATGESLFSDGTALLPSKSYILDPDTGEFRLGANIIGWSTGGVERMRLNATGLGIETPTINWSGLGADHTVLTIGDPAVGMGVLELSGLRTSDAGLGRLAFSNGATRLAEMFASRIDDDTSTMLTFATANAGSLSNRLNISKIGILSLGSGALNSTKDIHPTGLTSSSGTGLTVNNYGELSRDVHKVTVDFTALAAAGLTADKVIATLPAKTRLVGIIAETTIKYIGGAVTAATLIVGKTTGGNEYLVSHDVFTAAIVRGDNNDAHLGTSINRANANSGGDLPSWTGTTSISVRLTTVTGNTNVLTQGSTTYYLETVKMP